MWDPNNVSDASNPSIQNKSESTISGGHKIVKKIK